MTWDLDSIGFRMSHDKCGWLKVSGLVGPTVDLLGSMMDNKFAWNYQSRLDESNDGLWKRCYLIVDSSST